MKKNVLLAKMLMVMIFAGALTWSSISSVYAQLNYTFDFNANSTGWTGNFGRFTGATACGGTGGAMRRNLYSGSTTGQLISPTVGTSNGMQSSISYSYKVNNWSANNVGTAAPWGSFVVQYGASATGPWTTFATVTNEAQTSACITKTHTGVVIPAGTTFIRWSATFAGSGDYYLNFDNIVITQDAAFACSATPAPGNTLSSPASVCANANFTLSLQNATLGSGVTHQWQSSANGVDWTDISGATGPTRVQTQTAATHYRCNVTCAGNGTTASNSILVNMNSIQDCYCTPIYTVGKTDGDLISQVQVTGTTLNNNSGTSPVNPAFTFFNTLPEHTGNLQAGTTYNINVTYGSFTSQQCAVWIDFNENGVFETPSERVGFTTSNSTAGFQTVSFPISLPCNPVPGLKRMRVRNVYFTNGNTIDPCASYAYGETEDYNVTILPPPPCPSITGLTAGTPGSFNVLLNWTLGCAESAWNVEYGPTGFTPGTGTTVPAGTNVNFDLTGLSASTAYHVYVSANCGGAGNSAPFGPIAFTTDVAPCSGTPVQATTLSSVPNACLAQNFTLSMNQTYTDLQITYQWQSSLNNVDWTDISGATNPTRVQTQTEATWYRCIVTCNASSQSMTSTAIQVTMGLPTQCYCEPVYTVGKTDGDLISQVQVTGTTLNNNSGTDPVNPAFTYFNTLPEHTGNLQAGTTYNVNVTYGSFTAQQCAVWIDFNENGVFETPSERVGFTTSNSTAGFQTVSFPISLPCNPVPGVKRMRVRNVYATAGNTIDPCASYSYGETEDYNVTILPPPACPSVSGLTAGTPGAFNVVLNWNQGCAESAWNVEYGPVGFTPGTGTTVPAGTNVNFDLTGLNSSTAYHAYVSANCGVDGTSAAFGPVAFTTTVAPCSGTPVQSATVGSVPSACIGQSFTLSMNQTYNDLQISYQWQSSANGVDWANISGQTSATTLQSQTDATWYRCVVTCDASGMSMNSTPLQMNMGLPTQCYCQAAYSSGKTAGDLISNVQIPGTTLANNSGTAQVNPAYTYFFGQANYTAELVQGGSYNVTISVGTWGDQHLRAWIDYNDNGVFEASESIGSTVVAPGAGFTGPFPPAVFSVNLSGSAPLGTHRMRVRGVWQSVPSEVFAASIDPCASYSYGETEDYDITIVAPVTSQLIASHCGLSNVAMTQNLLAVNVTAPAYRFRVQGANNGGTGWNNNIYIYDAPAGARNFRFQFIPGSTWGATYAVTVAVGDGFGNFGPYGTSCNVTLAPLASVPLPTLENAFCGATVSHTTDLKTPLVQGALGYRFRINGGQEVVSTDRNVKMSEFSTVVWGQTYSVDVAVQSADGSWSSYGTPCNVTVSPTTQLEVAQCNIINVLTATELKAVGVNSATGFRFRITGPNNAGPGWNGNVFILDRPNRVFTFNMVPGSLQGETYTVEVAASNNSADYAAYGSACNITLFGAPAIVINENEMMVSNKTMDALAFGVNASHNPFTVEFGLQVLNANDSETINVAIYDMSGKLIESHAVNPMDIENVKFGSNLASGMYMIEVKQGTNQTTIRQVKN